MVIIGLSIALAIAIVGFFILLNILLKNERVWYADMRAKNNEVQHYKKSIGDLHIQIRHLEDEAVSFKKIINILKINKKDLVNAMLKNEKEIRHLKNQLIQKR